MVPEAPHRGVGPASPASPNQILPIIQGKLFNSNRYREVGEFFNILIRSLLEENKLNCMASNSIERIVISEPFLKVNTVLGEGPFYRQEDDTLHFVDIKAKLMHCVPLSGSKPPKALKVDDSLGVACLIENDDKHYIVAAKRGFGLVDQETGKLTYLAKAFGDAEQELRLNIFVNEYLILQTTVQ